MKYKYEGFQVGQKIRAYDFEPLAGRAHCYVEGGIVAVRRDGVPGAPYAHYVITVTKDVYAGVEETYESHSRLGKMVLVPMESTMDYEGRVTEVT